MQQQQWAEIKELVIHVLLAQFENLQITHIRRYRDLLRQSQVCLLWNRVVNEKILSSIEQLDPRMTHLIKKTELEKFTGLVKLGLIPYHKVFVNLRELEITKYVHPDMVHLTRLETLNLCLRNGLDYSGLFKLTNLTCLTLRASTNSRVGPTLANFPHLQQLSLWNNYTIKPKHIISLKLTKLELCGAILGITQLLPRMTQLEELIVSKNSEITDEAIKGLTQLKSLSLHQVNISSKAIHQITGLEKISLCESTFDTDPLKKLTNLTELRYNGPSMKQMMIQPDTIQRLTRLKTLVCRGLQFPSLKYIPQSLTYIDTRDGGYVVGSLGHLTNLTTLVDGGHFSIGEYAKLNGLRTLDTQRDITEELSLRPLTQIQRLTCFCLKKPSLEIMTKLSSLRHFHVLTSEEIDSETDAAFLKHGITLHYR